MSETVPYVFGFDWENAPPSTLSDSAKEDFKAFIKGAVTGEHVMLPEKSTKELAELLKHKLSGGKDQAELADLLKRKLAAVKDQAMLGDSGYERIEADFYPTPPENVDCALTHVIPIGKVWEPACGDGAISRRLQEFGYETWSSDLNDQGYGLTGIDFFAETAMPDDCRSIWTNPPYATTPEFPKGMAEAFVRHALKLTEPVKGQVAMFLRNEFDCGKGRMELFNLPPFHKKIVVTKRPRWIAGSTGSPRHNYAWFVWDWRHVKGAASVSYVHPDTAKPFGLN